MKKLFFIIAFVLCLMQLVFWLFFPFMGPETIIHNVGTGMFGITDALEIQEFQKNNANLWRLFQVVNKTLTVVYFGSIAAGVLLPPLMKKSEHRHNWTIYLFLLSILCLCAGKILTMLLFKG